MQAVAAFILAGGKSTRMGRDKAFVLWEGSTLLESALGQVRKVVPNPRIVGSKEKYESYAPVVEDTFLERGPLGGIHAALRTTDAELNLVLAVDLPYVTPELLQYLVVQAEASQALITVPRFAEGWQPLCAIYRKDFAAIAEDALRAGRNAIYCLLESNAPNVLDEAILTRAGFSAQMFRNINAISDLSPTR